MKKTIETNATLKFNGVAEGTAVKLMNLSPSSLRHAARIKERIDQLQTRFKKVLRLHPARPAAVKPIRVVATRRPKRHMSLATRRAIGKAQKRIWKKRRLQEA